MKNRQRQAGITLVVSLIMLIVLTLLVVSAIRFGNINLKIAGNAQAEAEATAAAQVGIEKMLVEVVAAEKIDTVPAKPALAVSTGGFSYSVRVEKPVCVLTKNIPNTSLDPTNAADVGCFEDTGGEPIMDQYGNPILKPSACRSQQWDIEASVTDAATGAKVGMLQGIKARVPAQTQCAAT